MKATTRADIQELLNRYNELGECIIEKIEWADYGTTVRVVFNYVWDEQNNIRKNLDQPKLLTLSFYLVQEFHLINALNYVMCEEPERINWGLNEIAAAKLENQEAFLSKYSSLPVQFHHMALLWEGARRWGGRSIEIIFSWLEVADSWT